MRADLEVRGDKEAAARLSQLGNQAVNTGPLLTAIGVLIQEGLRRNFETQGAYLGGKGAPWPKLSPETLSRKTQSHKPLDLMRVTDALRQSLSGGQGHVFRVAKTQVRVGTKDFRARIHQGGTPQGEPARKLVGIARIDAIRIFGMIRRHLLKT